MKPTANTCADTPRYELRFASLFHEGRGFAFSCDANGVVDLAALNDRARRSYLSVRRLVGREVSLPAVCSAELH